MKNPFDNPIDMHYVVLVNEEGQHSLWPALSATPLGWKALHGPDGRQGCLDFVEANWTDQRPRSLQRMLAPSNQ